MKAAREKQLLIELKIEKLGKLIQTASDKEYAIAWKYRK